jgi:hypothetical protein
MQLPVLHISIDHMLACALCEIPHAESFLTHPRTYLTTYINHATYRLWTSAWHTKSSICFFKSRGVLALILVCPWYPRRRWVSGRAALRWRPEPRWWGRWRRMYVASEKISHTIPPRVYYLHHRSHMCSWLHLPTAGGISGV